MIENPKIWKRLAVFAALAAGLTWFQIPARCGTPADSEVGAPARDCTLTCTATAVPQAGDAPLVVAFEATATSSCNDEVTFLWVFGDGTPAATGQNLTHTYGHPGLFPWLMTATSASGAVCVKGGLVRVSGGDPCSLTCEAAAEPTSGAPPLTVAFTADATPTDCTGGVNYLWTFGDGSPPSADQNPVHTYNRAGTFKWHMMATAGGAFCNRVGTIVVSGGGGCYLSCQASAAPANGDAPLDVAFTASAEAHNCDRPVSYAWDFGDGQSSADQNPSHTYVSPGLYGWKMTATSGAETCVRMGMIRVNGQPPCVVTCTASASPVSGPSPLTVSFASAAEAPDCADALSIMWEFGDGTTSASQNATHTYTSPGVYHWTFVASAGAARCVRDGVVRVEGSLPGLSLGDATAGPGTTVSLPLALSGAGAPVCATSSDLPFRPDRLTFLDAQPGPAATAAEKQVVFSTPSEGLCRVAVFGTNQITIPDGIVAYVRFSVATSASGRLRVGNRCAASDCQGNILDSHCSDAIITIVAAAMPGDCDGNGTVSIGEIQKVVNMFLGVQEPGCGADCDGDGAVSVGEIQKAVNAFLGISTSC